MGNSNTNPIEYQTKDGLQISYIFWDLKGKNRFPQPPGDHEVNFMLQRCLQEIDASPDQLKQIKQFNTKYKYRFVILHKRKVAQAKKQKQLQNFKRQSVQLQQMQFAKSSEEKSKTKDLEQLMKDVELNQTVIKVALMKIDKYIAERYAHNQFITIRGLERLLQLLQKAIKLNATGTKTNFSNQIQLLKFFKFFSDRYPKQFYNYIPKIKNYARVIIKTYHPVNTHITAYCLNLLTDYLWRVQQGEDVIKVLQQYRLDENFQSFLSPFAQSIQQTDSILMVYYNLKFINELIAAVIEEDKKEILKQNLSFVKYGYILDNVKVKLEQMFYNIDSTTFIAMHQKIFKYVTKEKSQKRIPVIQENRSSFRNTLNFNALHEHILLNFLETQNQANQDEDNQENMNQQIIIAYLGESDRKHFNKFILDTLTQIQKYSKLELYLDGESNKLQSDVETQQMVQSKINLQNLEAYFGRIKQSCTKNNCNQLLNACFKNLQYFEKAQWKHLDRFILEELGLEKKIADEVQQLKRNLQQKQNMVKRIIKQNIDLRNQLSELRMKDNSFTQRTVGKLSSQNKDFFENSHQKSNQALQNGNFSKKKNQINNLPLPPKGKKIDIPQMPASLSKFLPKVSELPPPPNMAKKTINSESSNTQLIHQKPMRDKPKLSLQAIKQLSIKIHSTKQNNSILSPQLNNSSLPPPPPSLSQVSLPPPPPSLNSVSLPPLPLLGSVNLPPPPPSLHSVNLHPPPSLGTVNLPPPPPSLSSVNLPPPPSIGGTLLPPPPSMNGPTGLANLPPPPSVGGLGLPSVPTLGIGNPLIGGSATSQKVKQKRKPKVPLKACNYTVLNYDKIVNTVFEQIDDTKYELDEDQLVDLFAKNTVNKEGSTSYIESKSKSAIMVPSKSKEVIKLLGSDRWRNVQIILTKLKIPQGQMKKALIYCTGKYIAHSVVEAVSKILPNQEQEQMIRAYDGNQEDLGKPEKFFKQLIQVKEYASRVRAMIFSNIKDQFYYELSSKIEQLQAGFFSLKENKRLKHVLEVCLALGNYLNGTSLKGGAWGFKLQTIERLEQIKSLDNKTNAAFYLIKEVWRQYPYPIFDKDEIQLYQYLSKMPISQINQQLGELNMYHKSIKRAYQSHEHENQSDHIGQYCEQMMVELDVKIQEYKRMSQKLKQTYLQCAKYFCDDGTKTVSDQFGKKMFQCILFISNTQKMFKIIEDKRQKEQTRKAVKNELTYTQTEVSNPQSNKKQTKETKDNVSTQKVSMVKLPGFNNLPVPPLSSTKNKQQKLKEMQKIQQERQKKALQEVMMRRTSKLQAYRMSKMSQTSINTKKVVEEIDFLKGIN